MQYLHQSSSLHHRTMQMMKSVVSCQDLLRPCKPQVGVQQFYSTLLNHKQTSSTKHIHSFATQAGYSTPPYNPEHIPKTWKHATRHSVSVKLTMYPIQLTPEALWTESIATERFLRLKLKQSDK